MVPNFVFGAILVFGTFLILFVKFLIFYILRYFDFLLIFFIFLSIFVFYQGGAGMVDPTKATQDRRIRRLMAEVAKNQKIYIKKSKFNKTNQNLIKQIKI